MAKKLYPGGFRLMLKTARALAVQEFGTCKGLKQSDWHNSEGFYEMTLGNLKIEIHPDMNCSGCIQIDVSMQGGKPESSTSVFAVNRGYLCSAGVLCPGLVR